MSQCAFAVHWQLIFFLARLRICVFQYSTKSLLTAVSALMATHSKWPYHQYHEILLQ